MRRKVWQSITIISFLIICFAVLGAILRPDGSNNFIVAVVSLAVALVAIYFSLRTYYSIDEVNAISRMDGNVMENPRYRPNILRFIFRFTEVDYTKASEDLLKDMEEPFLGKGTKSGAHLADSVQEVADMMVLIPFFIHTTEYAKSAIHQGRVSNLLKIMKYQVRNFKEISDGSCKLLEETVNLIEAVFAYQNMSEDGSQGPAKLLEIRGSIFITPVTCILYNNYLGLYLLRRARMIISAHDTNLSPRELMDRANICSSNDKSIAYVYCSKAVSCFKRAEENIGDDMIWKAFVCFNVARADYMKQILNESFEKSSPTEWEEYINESIRNWMTANQIIAEHFAQKDSSGQISYLQQALISQENKVRLFKVVIQMINKQPLTDHNGNPWVSYYRDVTDTAFFKGIPEKDPQNQTDILIQDIMMLLKDL
jgi:hypothetical protein